MKSTFIQALYLPCALFFVELSIKYMAFDSDTVILELFPSICLWITALYLTLSIAEHNKLGGSTVPKMKRKENGTGIEIEYKISLPKSIEPNTTFLYLFISSVVVWIISLIVSQKSLDLWVENNEMYSVEIIVYTGFNAFISFFTMGFTFGILKSSFNS